MMRWIGLGLASLAMLALLFGASGAHPAAHSLSLGRPFFALLCLLGLWAGRRWRVRGVFAVAAIWGGFAWLGAVSVADAPGSLRLYSKNLWHANTKLTVLAADILASEADLVLLQEVSSTNQGLLETLARVYPHQHLCSFSRWSGIAVLSRTPFEGEGTCSGRRALGLAFVPMAGQVVAVGSVHVPWPWPYPAQAGLDAIEDMLADIDMPVVLAGDFNSFPWSAGVQGVAQAARGHLATPLRPTLNLRGMPLPLDMAIAPRGGQVSYRPFLGSDHIGLVVDVGI